MSGWTRVSGSWRALSSAREAGLLLSAVACAAASCNVDIGSGVATAPPGEVTVVTGGSGPIDGAGAAPGCQLPATASPVFGDQIFSSLTVPKLELYTWTTDEQAAQLRKGQVLFSEVEPNDGSSLPFTLLSQLGSSADPEAALAQTLFTSFGMGRFAWPEPWPTRMGWPGADPGGQLVRIELSADAWFVVLEGGGMSVRDSQNAPVLPADALAHPERIGAIFFDSTTTDCGIGCGLPTSEVNSGFREFLVGNLAMITEWSIGTQQIHDRLSANVDQLTRFLNNTRSCPVTMDLSSWNQTVLSAWTQLNAQSGGIGAAGASSFDGGGGFGLGGAAGLGIGGLGSGGFAGFGAFGIPSEELAYDEALAIPDANYLAAPAQIATMIETLQGDLFEPDPLVVTPGSP